MTKIAQHDYTTMAGRSMSVTTLGDILKAAGLPVEGASCFRAASGSKLAGQFVVAWAAPKAAGAVKDEKASKGAATKGTALSPEAKTLADHARPLNTEKRMAFFAGMLADEPEGSAMRGHVTAAKIVLATEESVSSMADKMAKVTAALEASGRTGTPKAKAKAA